MDLVEDERRAKRSKLDIVMDDAQADPDNRTVIISDPEDGKDEWKAKVDVEMYQRWVCISKSP